MPISSLIIRTKDKNILNVQHALREVDGLSVEKVHLDNIVVVTDTQSQEEDKILWDKIEHIPGVVQCDLIYPNFEDQEGESL